MEQATNALNWRPSNAPKAPGQMAALSAQAIGRGADGILFFQWRQSRAGAEKFHSAMLPHSGTDTRTWREAVALGGQLAALPALPAGARDARVALVFDWENWWAVEASDHPSNVLDYLERRAALVPGAAPPARAGRHRAARARRRRGTRSRSRRCCTCCATRARPRSRRSSRAAGTCSPARSPTSSTSSTGSATAGSSRSSAGCCGIRLEDFGALVAPGAPDGRARRAGGAVRRATRCRSRPARCSPRRSTATDAAVEASFTSGRRAGHPALTARRAGRGVARYLATVPDEAGMQAVVDHVLADAGVEPVVAGLPEHVEAARRGELVTLDATTAATPSTCPSPASMPMSGEQRRRRCGSARSTGRWCSSDDGECSPGYDARESGGGDMRAVILSGSGRYADAWHDFAAHECRARRHRGGRGLPRRGGRRPARPGWRRSATPTCSS